MELQLPGTEVKRAYSLANTGNWDGRLEFLIRLREGGQFSSYLARRRPLESTAAGGLCWAAMTTGTALRHTRIGDPVLR